MSEMTSTLHLKSHEANLLFMIKVGKHNLIDSALHKIATLYAMAKKNNVYAHVELMQIKLQVDKLIAELSTHLKRTKKLIKKRMGYIPDITFATIAKHHLGCNLVLSAHLSHLITLFDEWVAWLVVAKNHGLFSHYRGFYKLKNQYRCTLSQCISHILKLKTKTFPQVTIDDYLNENHIYTKAASSHGTIKPQAVFDAIQSLATPPLSAQESNLIKAALKAKTQITTNPVTETEKA